MGPDDSDRITRETRDQSGKYEVLKTPCELTIPVTNYDNFSMSDGSTVHHLYVPCSEIKKELLPLDADPREPSTTSQVKDMRKTLIESPKDFVKKNNGITLFCDDVVYDPSNKNCKVTFGEREGVCNGGHTYFAIVGINDRISDDALVHLELIQIASTVQGRDKLNMIVDISRARNNNVRLAQTSEADYLEYYTPFKEKLTHQNWVIWHEGDSSAVEGAISAADFIRLLTALDPLQFYHPIYNPSAQPHKVTATQIAGIHNNWFEDTEAYHRGEETILPLGHMAVLGNDMFEIRDMIAKDLKPRGADFGKSFRHSNLYKEQFKNSKLRPLLTIEGEGVTIAPTTEVLIIGLFRTDLWLHPSMNGGHDYIGWFISPELLWEKRRATVMSHLADDYTSFNNDPKEFIRAAAPFRENLFELGTSMDPPFPEIIINTSTGERYHKVNSSAESTHYLKRNSPEGLLPKEDDMKLDSDIALYALR